MGGLPRLRLPVRGFYSMAFPPQPPSVLLAIPCPLPLKPCTSLSYVSDLRSPVDPIIPDVPGSNRALQPPTSTWHSIKLAQCNYHRSINDNDKIIFLALYPIVLSLYNVLRHKIVPTSPRIVSKILHNTKLCTKPLKVISLLSEVDLHLYVHIQRWRPNT